jgi:DNA modification methylase
VNKIEFGDCRDIMRRWAAAGVRAQTCVTSPPYFGLRDYGAAGQIGLEESPDDYVAAMVDVFRCVRDVLADDGTLWLNIGDSYASAGGQGAQTNAGRGRGELGQVTRAARFTGGDVKAKDLIGIPWMLAFALRADGWYLRQEIIWAKATSGSTREGSAMPESVRDRCAKAHETIFLLAKSPRYYFDVDAIKEPAQNWGIRDRSNMRGGTTDPKLKHGGLSDCTHEKGNRRSVWRCNPTRYAGAHFATYPPALITPCVLAGSRPGDIVLDPFMGSGTTAAVASQLGRQYLGCELNSEYQALQVERIAGARVPASTKKPRAARNRAQASAALDAPARPAQLEIFS